jgi:hypothetical protein
MAATDSTVSLYADKYGIDEGAVRDIAGLDAPVPLSISVEGNGATATFTITGTAHATVDFGDYSDEVVTTGSVTHTYDRPGYFRVRALSEEGTVRWCDFEVKGDVVLGEDPVNATHPDSGSDPVLLDAKAQEAASAPEFVAATDPTTETAPIAPEPAVAQGDAATATGEAAATTEASA